VSLICSQYDYSFVSTRLLCAGSYYGKIQDHDEAYYKSFNMIITGLDSVEARRWINATLVGMVDEDDPESLKPLIDGGTEGAFWGLRGGPSVVG
jgi:molybdopterin/thiamine biosynthesis adenylyltransferase